MYILIQGLLDIVLVFTITNKIIVYIEISFNILKLNVGTMAGFLYLGTINLFYL